MPQHPPPSPGNNPPNPDPHRPRLTLPPGACDSHCHVMGPFDRFPLKDDRTYTPVEAPETLLRRTHDKLGVERAVIVQSQGHGMDHSAMLAALEEGQGRYRGVALLTPATTREEIVRMDRAGVCGVRFNFVGHLNKMSPEDIRTVIDLVRPFGWHACLHVAGMDVVANSELIRHLGVPGVIDHMGRPSLEEGPDGPAIAEMRRLMDTGRIWVKLSGFERLSEAGAPYADTVPIARSLAAHAPERVLWATDWPHVNLTRPVPDDGDLVDVIAEAVPSAAAQRRLFVDNPVEFFGFKP